jgi:long-chain acyl-CoA synthetase
VLLAPEGRLSTTGELLEFKSGIGLLAVQLGVPVVPMRVVGLSGTVPMHAMWPKKHSDVIVRIGEPLRFGPEVRYRAATRAVREAVASL